MQHRARAILLASIIALPAAANGQEQMQVAAAETAAQKAKALRASDSVTVSRVMETPTEAAKTEIPLQEVPQAISVVIEDVWKDRGVIRLADALRGVAGISRSSSYGYYDAYTIRGYDAAYGSVFLDGLTTTNSAGTNNELAGLERIEVIKGPASALYGAAPLGGLVNLVSKRPRPGAFLDASLSTGSGSLFEGAIDANGALTASGDLLGRLNVMFRDGDQFVDFSGQQRIYIAPSLTWNIGDDTTLTFLGRYQRDHDHPYSPVPVWGTVRPAAFGELPIRFSINDNGEQNALQNQEHIQIGYVLEHRFSDDLKFNQTLRYYHRKTYWQNWLFAAGFVDDNVVDGVQQGHVIGRFVYGDFVETGNDFAVDSHLSARFDTGFIEHNILAGIDYRLLRSSSYNGPDGNFDAAANALDLLDPDYGAPLVYDPSGAYTLSSRASQIGIYLQDHMKLGERFSITLGGRQDWVKSDHKDSAFSPNVGLGFDIVPGATLYANWSKSFTPQFSWQTRYDGTLLPPETGRNLEAGIKFDRIVPGLTGMVTVFDLVRRNVATSDPAHPLFYIATGEQRSRGIEIEGTWKPTPAWSLSLAYSFINGKVTEDNAIPVGLRLPNLPKHNLYIYSEYVVPDGPLANLGFSVGWLYNSRKNGTLLEDLDFDGVLDPESAFTLPGYNLVDLGVSYAYENWEARLTVNNVLNKRYFPDACCLDRVTPGEPRNWRLTVSRRF